MPLINLGNRNTPAPATPPAAASPNDTATPASTPIPDLAPLPDMPLPQAQEIPVASNPVETAQPVIAETTATPTPSLNGLADAINNISGGGATVESKPETRSMEEIVSQVKEAVAQPAPTPLEKPEEKIKNTIEVGVPTAVNVTETSKPLPVISTPQPEIQDPSSNLDEKLNRLNNLNNIETGTPASVSSPIEPAPVSSPIEPAPVAVETGSLSNKTYTLDDYLQEGMKQNASDVHISAGYRVMIRVNGELKTIESPLITPEFALDYVNQLLKGRNVKPEEIHEYDMTYSLGNRRFRINIFKESGTFAVAARIISETIPTPEQLDLPPLMKEFAKFPNGLVLVTGPTGSGKSTTIASMINLINLTDSKHIITLEDPIEYVFPKALSMVDQREFGQDFQGWSDALRAILRQDPNIVLVGEMRDLDTVESALRIAETGHLVFATLHTNSASQTIDRIIDMFPAEKQEQVKVQLASVLQAVISQRLVKTLNNSRVASMEILIGTPAVRNTIRESKGVQLDNIIQTGADLGMISMEKSLVRLVKSGKVSTEAARGIANRPNDFDILLSKS